MSCQGSHEDDQYTVGTVMRSILGTYHKSQATASNFPPTCSPSVNGLFCVELRSNASTNTFNSETNAVGVLVVMLVHHKIGRRLRDSQR